jgi:manganese transport protein
MGVFTIKPWLIVLSSLITLVLVYLNLRMVYEQASLFFQSSDSVWAKALIIAGGLAYITLLLMAIFYPLFVKVTTEEDISVHPLPEKLQHVVIPLKQKMAAQKIAVALDFSKNDHKLIGHALGQGTKESHYLLIHVVESPATRFLGDAADDMETRNDKERMDKFVEELREKGYIVEGVLGYNNRVKEIVRLVRQNRADLLVIGAHGHKGIRDVVYGQTVDEVRHSLRIPVLIINI